MSLTRATALRPLLRTSIARPATSLRVFHVSARRQEIFHDADEATFTRATQNPTKLVLVDFYADWCGPCKMLSPVLEKLADPANRVKSGSGREVDLVTVDTDVETALAHKYKVTSLPTVVAFKDGQPVSQFVGAVPEAAVRKFVGEL